MDQAKSEPNRALVHRSLLIRDDLRTVAARIASRSAGRRSHCAEPSAQESALHNNNSNRNGFVPVVILPLKPIWGAFIGNTLAMSLLIWCVAALPSILRKRFRRAQHQCLACGYDLRGTLHQSPR